MAINPALHRDTLFARIEVLSWRLQQGDDNDPARLLAAVEQAVAFAPELSLEDRQRLQDRLSRAQAAILAAQERIAMRMESLPSERRAVRGYVSQGAARPVTGRLSRRV
jgi:hypothetical protein